MLRKRLGKRIKDYRKAKGWSQMRLAEKSGVSWQHVGSIERAERSMTVDVLDQLCAALGCDPVELLTEETKLSAEIEALLKDIPRSSRQNALAVIRDSLVYLRDLAGDGKRKR